MAAVQLVSAVCQKVRRSGSGEVDDCRDRLRSRVNPCSKIVPLAAPPALPPAGFEPAQTAPETVGRPCTALGMTCENALAAGIKAASLSRVSRDRRAMAAHCCAADRASAAPWPAGDVRDLVQLSPTSDIKRPAARRLALTSAGRGRAGGPWVEACRVSCRLGGLGADQSSRRCRGGGGDCLCAFGQEPLSERQAQPGGAAGDQCQLPTSSPVVAQCRTCSV